MLTPTATDIERFLAYVEVRGPRQCWWWLGSIHPRTGHPLFYMPLAGGSKNPWVPANRFAWEHVYERGVLGPSEIIVRAEHDWDRTCPQWPTCPHITCLNPDHMRVITRADRGREMGLKNRRNP